jgi:aspartate/methionine/tyrosine aminotransferase
VTLPVFALEDYFEPREHTAKHLFSSSDLQTYSLQSLLENADSQSLSLWHNLSLGYTEARGLSLLRAQIAQLYQGLTLDHVLVCAGAEEAIYAVMHALLQPADHIVTVKPGYSSLQAIAAGICSVSALELTPENQWQLDLSALEALVRPNTKMIVVNYPHNPTGATIDRKTYDALIDLARRHNVWLFFDEVYRLLEVDAGDRLPPIADTYEKGISLSVMSKAYGLAGLRIGWIASQDATVINRTLQMKYYLSICNSAPSEVLALMALRQSDRILSRNHALMCSNLQLLDQFFADRAAQFNWVRPKGGCTGFAQLTVGMDIDDFADKLLAAKQVMILPGTVYDHLGNFFRISYGRADMPDTLALLTAFLDEHFLV